jgi:hypothetical protein
MQGVPSVEIASIVGTRIGTQLGGMAQHLSELDGRKLAKKSD